MKKIKSFFKKIKTPLFYLLSLIAGLFTVLFIRERVFTRIGKVKYNRKFTKIPGQKTKVIVKNYKGKKLILNLPKNPETQKQITVDEIKQVGLPEDVGEGTINVEVNPNNNIIDRRSYHK